MAVAERIAKPGDKVLDVGCGVGGATSVFAERVGPDGLAAGVDINSALIDVAARRAQGRRGAEFQVADELTRKLTSTIAAAIPNPNSARELPTLARLAGQAEPDAPGRPRVAPAFRAS